MPIAIVSEKANAEIRAALMREGFSVFSCPASSRLSAPIAHHPDMLMAILGKTVFCHENYRRENAVFFSSLMALRPESQIVGLPDAPEKTYPKDCAYNLLRMGERVFFNPQGLSPSLAYICREKGLLACHTRQGYAACTVRALGHDHAITADRGMAKILRREGICVLTVGEHGIALPPYANGFIGGASGCFGNTVYFFGKIETHPDYGAIRSFAIDAGFVLKSLSEEPLHDLGGILFIE